MFFRQFYDEWLAQASYMLASTETKEALVVDPRRDVDVYLAIAAEHEFRIVAVTETHIHADFLSGSRELAAATGAKLYLSAAGGSANAYLRDRLDSVAWLRDGDEIALGELTVQALHTPGHTPEHLCFAISQHAQSSAPMLLLSGDFIFVGDLGRPDLLEEALGQRGAADAGARALYASLQRSLGALPDFVQIWPAHGAGSACGRALGAMPSTTLGYERRFAWWSGYLERGEENAFVTALLRDQPDAPRYFAAVKDLNRGSAPLLHGLPRPTELDAAAASALQRQGALLIDTRPSAAFIRSHPNGALHIPDGSSFSNWSAWFVPTASQVVLIAQPERVEELVRGLIRVGIDHVVGYITDATAKQLPQSSVPSIGPEEANERIARNLALLIDVRSRVEFNEAHVPGAKHISAGKLVYELASVPKEPALVVCCATGERSLAATSALLNHGFNNVSNLCDGVQGWIDRHLPVESQ